MLVWDFYLLKTPSRLCARDSLTHVVFRNTLLFFWNFVFFCSYSLSSSLVLTEGSCSDCISSCFFFWSISLAVTVFHTFGEEIISRRGFMASVFYLFVFLCFGAVIPALAVEKRMFSSVSFFAVGAPSKLATARMLSLLSVIPTLYVWYAMRSSYIPDIHGPFSNFSSVLSRLTKGIFSLLFQEIYHYQRRQQHSCPVSRGSISYYYSQNHLSLNLYQVKPRRNLT